MEKNNLSKILVILFFLSVILGLWIIIIQPTREKYKKTSLKISQDKIAIVNVYGAIRTTMNSDPFSKDSDRIVKRLKKLEDNNTVKAVVLRINSPGGSVGAVQEIYSALLKLRKKNKVIVASFGDVAASGGYYLAVGCDKIVANPGTLTGSIGVILETGNFSELMKKIGVKIETIKSGKHKDIGSFAREMTSEERKILQDLINDAYEQFLSAVITGRKLEESKARELADGRIFTGSQAKEVGLIDEIGGLDVAVDLAKKLANLGDNYKIMTDYDQWDRIFDFIPSGFEEKAFSKILPDTKIRFEYMLE
ncbi:MAG TPA: signal peptide peptidase SppA [Elusimicrobia bacterium]|nr:MAG: hypothetical protein A2551_04315 [Elusimicrobia bacterium RIFOXYD2_FULL_34_30]HAM39501.1 signal peptide peptidase SppA [Elusimicrobiota bacterium]